jgi:voltage-gated potassium channel Kch
MLGKLYTYRFEIFFISQLVILFGSLVVPAELFEAYVSPLFFQINIIAGIILLSDNKRIMWFLILMLVLVGIIYGQGLVDGSHEKLYQFLRMGSYFLFYLIVTYHIIKQVWQANVVGKNVIIGLISGYLSLGMIGFFICISIEMWSPGSFHITELSSQPIILIERLMYFSYITLMTIGYGDIIPITAIAQKATVLIGISGQIYLVVLTAIVVGKYVSQKQHSPTEEK